MPGRTARGQGGLRVGLAAVGLLALALSASALAAADKTLTRVHDPVVVSTGALAAVQDRRTSHLRLYRVAGGGLQPVPFQFDACDRKGELVIGGPREFAIDDNDELVFMALDTGARADAGLVPGTSDAVLEIEVTDPVTGGVGWVYLLHFPAEPPPPVATAYVAYDPVAQRASSALYAVDYAPARNFFTAMRVTREGGGTGENLLRRTRMHGRPTFSLLLASFSLDFTERNSIVAVDGVENGPVRAVRRVQLSVDLGPLFPELPSGTVYTSHYRSSFVTPTRFGVPWMALKTLRDFRFENFIDFNPQVLPLQYWDGANPQGLAFPESGTQHVDTATDHDWWVSSGAAGTMLHAFVIPDQWRAWGVARGTVFRSTPARGKRREPSYSAGYSLLQMINLRHAGSYDLRQATVILPRPFQPGDEVEPMAMLRQPLRTTVHPLRLDAQAELSKPAPPALRGGGAPAAAPLGR